MAKQDDYIRYTIRVPADLYQRVQDAADREVRSVNAEIVSTLEEKYPDPKADMELSTLAAWLEYVRSGGPDDEIDDRMDEINRRLAKHPATTDFRLQVMVSGPVDDLKAEVILAPMPSGGGE